MLKLKLRFQILESQHNEVCGRYILKIVPSQKVSFPLVTKRRLEMSVNHLIIFLVTGKLTAKNRFYYDESRPLKKHHEVYIGYIKTPDDKIAVKVIGKNFREIEHLMKFSKTQRENVVTYRDWDKIRYNPRKIGIALELCHKDTLAEIIKKKLLKGKQLKKVMIHIMRGLSSIHENDILHRDLKPHNILCSRDGTIIKISDFGLSKQMEDGQSEAAKSQSICGTEGWGSPEHYGGKGKVMSKKSDIFSAGLIYYYILSEGKLIYEDVYKFIYEMTDKQIVTIPALHCEEAELATDLISKMLQCDQDRRPDCSEVLAHPYLWSDLKKIDFIHHVCTFIKRHLNEKEDTDVIIKEILSDLDSDPYDWHEKMLKSDKEGAQYLATRAKEGKYRTSSTKDLIRFIRNMDEHYPNYPELVSLFKNTRSSVWPYFSTLFPELLPKVFNTLHKHLSSMDEIPELTDIKSLLTEPAPYEHLVPFEDVPFKKRKL